MRARLFLVIRKDIKQDYSQVDQLTNSFFQIYSCHEGPSVPWSECSELVSRSCRAASFQGMKEHELVTHY